jgi:hypothetical protein
MTECFTPGRLCSSASSTGMVNSIVPSRGLPVARPDFAERRLLVDGGPSAEESKILRRLALKYLGSSAHKRSHEFIGGGI